MFDGIRSLVLHLEHFVLQHPETTAVGCSREVGVALLAVRYLVFGPVVAMGKDSVGTIVIVATVCQYEVMASSKNRTPTPTPTTYQVESMCRDILLLPVEGEQEGPHTPVMEPATTCIPGVVGIAADDLAELGADQGHSVPLVVAFLMEGCCSEVVLRGSEDPIYPLGVAEDVSQESCLLWLMVQDGGVDFKGASLLLDLQTGIAVVNFLFLH